MMKTIFSTLLAAAMLLSVLTGCGKSDMSGESRNTPGAVTSTASPTGGAKETTPPADGTADGVIDDGEDAVDGVVGAGEDAVNDVVGAGEDAVNGIIDAGEDAVDDMTGSEGTGGNSGSQSTPKATENN